MRHRVKEGDVMEIQLDNGYYYALQLPYGITRFLNFRSQDRITNILSFNYDKYMFDVAVFTKDLASGVWKVIARNIPIPLNTPKYQYIHFEEHNPNIWELYNLESGEITTSSKEECMYLERCAVWPQWKIEERIRHYFSNEDSKSKLD